MRDIIENPVTGDKITFLRTAEDSDGRISKFIMTLAPKSSWAKKPQHFHPYQKETFKVISGELNLNIGKKHYVLKPEDKKVIVHEHQLHSFWNALNNEVVFQVEIMPSRNIEKGLRFTYELAQKGKITKWNLPYNPLLTVILLDYFEGYIEGIPWKLQKWLFRTGAKLSRILGN